MSDGAVPLDYITSPLGLIKNEATFKSKNQKKRGQNASDNEDDENNNSEDEEDMPWVKKNLLF